MVVAFDDPPWRAVGFDELLASDAPVPAFAPDPAAASTIGYTSGTTGHPKGAVQSHRAVLLNCALTATKPGSTSADVVVTGEALRLIGRHSATMFEGVPAMYATILADAALERADLSSLTRCTVGGQTMALSTIERWQARSGAP